MFRRATLRSPHRSIPRRSDDRRKRLAVEPLEDRRMLSVASFQDGVFPAPDYDGTRDAPIFASDADVNFGDAVTLRADAEQSSTGEPVWSLIKWDLSSIPPGATIDEVSLSVNITNITVAPGFHLFEVKTPWLESEVTWNGPTTDSTWEDPGLIDPIDAGDVILGTLPGTALGPLTISLTAEGLDVVQGWINDPSSNYGFLLANRDNDNSVRFDSREGATAADRPKLTVDFDFVDTDPPTAALTFPADGGPADQDDDPGEVRVGLRDRIEIQLSDYSLNDATVTSEAVTLTKDGQAVPGIAFSFDAATDLITLTPPATPFPAGDYLVILNDSDAKIADTSGNQLPRTVFTIQFDDTLPTNPVARDDSYETDEDTPLIVSAENGVLANDDDGNNAQLTAVVVQPPGHGSVDFNENGSFTYTPEPDYNGPDMFSYRHDITLPLTVAPATVTLSVTPINDPPIAMVDEYVVAFDSELSVDVTFGILANDIDVDLDPLSATVLENPIHGTLTLNPDGSFVYTPIAGSLGTDFFIYQVMDSSGEVDQAVVTLSVEHVIFDFGDAPTSYATLNSENGPRHAPVGPTLGETRDAESDGQPSADASGDGADEDGVTFGEIRVAQLGALVTVSVRNAPEGAKLDAWIDFNGDGTFDGPEEQIFDDANVSNGDNALRFDVPRTSSGNTFARFRLSTEGDLGVGGSAADGEVEDYQITILPGASFGEQNTISIVEFATSVVAADIDGDGDIDVLSSSLRGNQIVWYENDGSEGFTAHTISTDADEAWSVFAADVDGDGDVDVLSASGRDDKIAWYENDGSQRFTAHIISVGADRDGAHDVFAVDLDGDGDVDVLSVSKGDDLIVWHENDGNQNFTAHNISTAADGAQSVFAADMDGDGDIDVLSASLYDDLIAWYENDGSQNFSLHNISTPDPDSNHFNSTNGSADGAKSVFAVDVDGDGDIDVLSASDRDDKIAWYENDGSQRFTAHIISTDADGAWSVFAADLDGDGDIDVLSASFQERTFSWYENDGSQRFTSHTIGSDIQSGTDVLAADVDGDGDLDVLGASTNDGGKIVWYENGGTNRPPADYGDAPAPYPTLRSAGGAFHDLIGPTLGATRDGESDGVPSNRATGDGMDEDGVTYGPIMVGQIDASVTVNVQNAPAGAKLDAWIDFNGDGDWGGVGEQIFDSVSVINGDNALLFDVPSWSTDSYTFTRFRLSTEGDLGVGGSAADGEIEDYRIAIHPTAEATGGFAGQNIVGTSAGSPFSLFAADLDGDGDLDVLSGSAYDERIVWYENDGNQRFAAHTISTDVLTPRSVFAADVDGDGDIDVLSASRSDDKIAWYENDGSGGFIAHIISTDADGAHAVSAADVDGDGDLDVLSASVNDNKIAWYENDGSQGFTTHIISTNARGARSVFAIDVDGDGDVDVLSASAYDDKIAWYENDGSQGFTSHNVNTPDPDTNRLNQINGDADVATSVFAVDVDGDGDIDVLSSSVYDDKIAWYENDGSQNFTAHTISTSARRAESVFAVDVDGDGDIDVLSASSRDDKIAWYRNDGSENFTAYTISTAADGARSVFAADVDGDGDIDVLSASILDGKIAWYENLSPIAPGPPADLTGDGFVDFQDLTILLAHWDQMVSAGQGNLVDPLSTPINFQDLTFLLAAWTGPGGAASPQAAAVVGGESYRRRDRRATDLVIGEMRDGSATGVASYRARRAETRSRPLGGIYRLQAVAVDRAMGEEAFPLLRRARPARR